MCVLEDIGYVLMDVDVWVLSLVCECVGFVTCMC